MGFYFNSKKSNCDLGDTIVKTKFDEDCKSLLNNSLETLIIPNDAKEINVDWSHKTSIKTLKFEEPYKLDYVGGFNNLTSLETVYIPDSVTKLGYKKFDEEYGTYTTVGFSSSGVKTVIFGKNSQLKTISDSCFSYCSSLSDITIPNSVTSLGNNCFSGCTSLQSITIPNSVTSIGSGCFMGDGWTDNGYELSITFEEPCQLNYISNSCFYGQIQLKSFEIPSSITSLRSNCFQSSGLQSITIPNTVQTMTEKELVTNLWGEEEEQEANSQFMGCESLAEVIFEEPCQIKKISNMCFQGCKLTSITIPSSVEEIGTDCFVPHWDAKEPITITINKPEGSIAGAPWGATNATIVWNG